MFPVERIGLTEHPVHELHTGDIPAGYVPVERTGPIEHPTRVLHAGDIPFGYIPVECIGTKRTFQLMSVTPETSQPDMSPLNAE